MPMGATLALRTKDKKFTRRIDGAKRRSSVPHGHFAPLPGTLVGSTGFIPEGRAVVLIGEGERALRTGAPGVKTFLHGV
jgi:hypothetical protein